jgi:hypothetical protein
VTYIFNEYSKLLLHNKGQGNEVLSVRITNNLRRCGRITTAYVTKEMSHVYLPKVGIRLAQYFSISE